MLGITYQTCQVYQLYATCCHDISEEKPMLFFVLAQPSVFNTFFCLEKNLTGFIYSSAILNDFRMVMNSLCKMERLVSCIIVLIYLKCQSYLFLFLVTKILSGFFESQRPQFLLFPLPFSFFCQKTIFFVKRDKFGEQ